MNINPTSNENSNVKETTTSQTKQTEKEEGRSFDEEYNRILAQSAMVSGSMSPEQIVAIINSQKGSALTPAELSGLRISFNYNTLNISKEDAEFFNSLIEKTDYIVNQNADSGSFQANLIQVVNNADGQNTKTAEVSKALMNLIEEAFQTQKPARIDFDNNVSVILKINRDGKLTAEFIPGDKAVEEYLRNNIGFLKSALDEKNINYEDILYKPYKNNSKQQNRRNGGNKNE